ncbi:Antigen p97-like protein [Halocaridina rubra]|uniref:Antigen p97-like protein n=1 Tax=Halocaridina rubra TaxID=373956 RepID=A0AAN9ABW9_HALRR
MPPKCVSDGSDGSATKKRKAITMEIKTEVVNRAEKEESSTNIGRNLRLAHKFKTEWESGVKIPFLDVLVLREPNKYSFTVSGYKLDHPNFKDSVIICVQTKAEQEKCEDLAKATMAYTASEGIGVKCSLDEAGSGCYPNIYFGRADVITLDGGDVYQVTEDYGFERLLSEVYVDSSVTSASSYYAVAVIRAESNITSFEQLQGRKSCHTGIDKTAGWKMPVASLLEQRLIDPRHCNYISAIAEFFSGGSCAPGAKSNRYNKEGNYIERLCRLCTGEGENQCARGNDEPFYSYAGAFRCLVHGGGDVAFVKHTTVSSLTGGKTSASWAVGLQADQFRLLCPLGGIAAVSEYKTCHIALVPAHEVVVSGRMPEARKTKIRETLLGISQIFNPEAAGYKTFRLFGSYHGIPDLLYKDSAVALRSLSEDTIEERARKKNYFKKLNELHGCEVRVCALEEQMHDCQAMAQTMLSVGQQFVCVSARDRYDCVRRVIRGQVDMSPVPGGFLGLDPDLRILAFMRDPVYSQQEYRYKAVMVVRRATVKNISDLRGKKSCHTGYGKTTGWRIPIAMLKRAGVIQPICEAHQSAIEHEIGSVAVTFNRACIPGAWAVSTTLDASLKNKYKAMCSMCRSKTCDSNDDYAGYEGALRCLTTENGGDVAFSKLSVVKEFFTDSRTVDSSEYGLLCPDNKIVNINSQEAENCYWAARPWDAYVTHGGASDAKVQKLFWALTEAKLKGEEDFRNRNWYFTTLGIGDNSDILPVMENVRTQDYYSKTRMDVVEAEDICTEEPVRFCVLSDEEENKCNDLKNVLRLNGITPSLQCVRGSDIDDCLSRININQADIISLNDIQRYKVRQSYNIMTLLSESYGQAGDTRYYLVGLVKKASGVISVADLAGRTTCYASHNVSDPLTIDDSLMKCLDGTSDFFHSYAEAITCLAGSNTDVAFVKVSISGEFTSNDEIVPAYLNPQNYEILCASGVLPLSASNIEDCNLGRVPANMVVTRQSDTSSRREDMINLLLKAAKYYGKSDSFFRLFYDYFSKPNLLFKDATTKLAPVTDDHYQSFLGTMWQQACGLYDHHLKMDNSY